MSENFKKLIENFPRAHSEVLKWFALGLTVQHLILWTLNQAWSGEVTFGTLALKHKQRDQYVSS